MISSPANAARSSVVFGLSVSLSAGNTGFVEFGFLIFFSFLIIIDNFIANYHFDI